MALPKERGILLGLVVVLAVLILCGTIVIYHILELHEAQTVLVHTHQVVETLDDILSLAKDAETGQRGFLITAEEQYLEPYFKAKANLSERIDQLTLLTRDTPQRQAQIPELRERIQRRISILQKNIDTRRTLGYEASREIVVAGTGKREMDGVRALVAKVVAEENKLMNERTLAAENSYRAAVINSAIAMALSILTVAGFAWFVIRNFVIRARAAAALHQEREQLRITLASIGDGVIATDIAGNVTFLNPIAEKLTGWTQAEAAYQPLEKIFEIVNETTRHKVENPAHRALVEGVIVGLANHTILISKQGNECAIADSAAPIRGLQHETLGSVLVFRDVTEDRAAERALRESESRKAAVLETALDAVITCDSEGMIAEFNPAAERMFGYQRSEIMGKELAELIVPLTLRNQHRTSLVRYLQTGQSTILNQRLELTALRADGSEFPVELAITRVGTEGKPFFTGYLRDISERKAAAAKLSQRMRLLSLNAEVSQALTTGGSLREMLQGCAEALVKHLDGAFARIWTVDEAREMLVMQASAGMYTHLDGPHGQVPIGKYKIGRIAAERLPHLTNAVIGDELVPEQEWAKTEGLTSFAGYPLLVGERLVGVLAMFARQDLEPHTLDTIATVAGDIALGIDRQRALRDLEENRNLLRVTLRSIGDAVLTTDAEGKVTFLNDVAQKLTGWSQQEAFGQPTEKVFHIVNESTEAVVESPVRKVLRDGVIVGLANHTVLIAKDGTRHPIDDSGAPIRLNGMIAGVVLVFRDVHERRKAEDDRQEFVSLVENSTDFIGIFDLKMQPTFINRAGMRLIGLDSLEQARQTPVREIFFPEDQDMVLHEFFPMVKRRGQGEIEIRFRHFKTGHTRWMLFNAIPLFDPRGKQVGMATVSRNITERKLLEDNLRQVAADLSEANRRKNEFLATLAHELRNPLAPIRTGLELMKLAVDDPVMLEQTRAMMERQTQQMVRLIDDLLDVSRITQGKLQLRRARVALADVIDSAVEATRPFIDEAGHELVITLPPQPITIDADPNRLAQVISNLLSNATKYTPDGGRIEVVVEQEDRYVTLHVKDTGLGIPPEMVERIFEMFTQIDRPLEKGYTGLGIGLTLVKRLVEMHQGSVSVASPGLNQGSVFSVALPIVVQPEQLATNSADNGLSTPRVQRKLRILVVDDNKAAAETLARVLGMMGHEVQLAHDGLEALHTAKAMQPELILMDLGMPKLSGYEAAKRIREELWGREMVLVALTGWGQDEDKQRTKAAGFDHHLTKPAEPTMLQELLADVESFKLRYQQN